MAENPGIHDVFMSLKARLARAILGIVPPKEVEDIVQETYVRVCQIRSTTEIREPQSFLFRIARNLALDHRRRAESRVAVSLEEAGDTPSGDRYRMSDQTYEEVATNEEFARFCEAVRHLPPQCRRAFVLKKVYGYSQREIAREMSISESTVEKHIAQGVKRCAQYLSRTATRRHEPTAGRSRASRANRTSR